MRYVKRQVRYVNWQVREPFQTEVDEAERNRSNEDAKNDSNDHCYYEAFNTTPRATSLHDTDTTGLYTITDS